MKRLSAALLTFSPMAAPASAGPAASGIGDDAVPATRAEAAGLGVDRFATHDSGRLTCRKAGAGDPVGVAPARGAGGAETVDGSGPPSTARRPRSHPCRGAPR